MEAGPSCQLVSSAGKQTHVMTITLLFLTVVTQALSGMDSGISRLNESQEHKLTHLLQDTAPDSTIKQDASHWRSWCRGCAKAKISPWRIKRITSAQGTRKEKRKLAYATWMVHTMMKPRSKSDPVAQPSSAYQVFLGAKRVHKRHCYDLEHGDIVLSTIKAITNSQARLQVRGQASQGIVHEGDATQDAK